MEGMERKTGTVDVMNTVSGNSFIKSKGIDGGAAYERMNITKETLEKYQAAINATNTADVVGYHGTLYNDLETILKAIIREEKKLIELG